ncbi:hypothetical protein DYH09_23155 [bacterium CPR1]|nr:hypothetical protein [bacterium CPR1]
MNGIVQLSGVQYSNHTQSVSKGRIRDDGEVDLHSQDEVTVSAAQPFQQTFAVIGDPVRVGRELGNVPAAHDEVGGVSEWLRGVSDERFYGYGGEPNYNGVLADLARQSWATFPDSLEDGRLPNLSTFQRAVAKERSARDLDLRSQIFLLQPELRRESAINVAVQRTLEQDVRSYSGLASEQSPTRGSLAFDPQNGSFTSVEQSQSSDTPYTVTAHVVENPEREVLSVLPSVTRQMGGLAAFLRQVPQELLYNDQGSPNYNKIFASLARANGVTGPEALEDGTLPNISTFQRSVARERSRREQEAAAVVASLVVGTGFAGPQGQRVLDLAAQMSGLK